MEVPRDSSEIGVSGNSPTAAPRLTTLPPSLGPSTTRQRSTRGHCTSACSATSRLAIEVIRIFDSAVVENVGHLVRGQIGIDARVIETGPFAGAAAFAIAGVVLHEDRIVGE